MNEISLMYYWFYQLCIFHEFVKESVSFLNYAIDIMKLLVIKQQ